MRFYSRKTKTPFQTSDQASYSGIQELIDSEIGLASYNKDLVYKFAHGLTYPLTVKTISDDVSVLEFGAGTGTLCEIFKEEFRISPDCVEIDDRLRGVLKSKGFNVFSNLKATNRQYSWIYTSNVLEHIEDDLLALKNLSDQLEVNGRIAIYVPALPILFSGLDRSVGHFRRYEKQELIHKVQYSGLKVESCVYHDFLGVFASLGLKVLGYKNKAGLGSKKSFLIYDQLVYPVSKFLDSLGMQKVIGKNLFLIAIKE